MKIVLFLFVSFFLACFSVSASVETKRSTSKMPAPDPTIIFDTVFYDLTNAVISSSNDSVFFDLPVFLKTDSQRNSIDFRFKFDQSKLTYISAFTQVSTLEVNPNFNSGFVLAGVLGKSPDDFVPKNTLLLYIRFKIASACSVISNLDFSSFKSFSNGDPCQSKMTNSGGSDLQLTTGVLCSDKSATFTGPTTIAGRAVSTYAWDLGNGTTSSLQSINTTYTTAGTYPIQLIMVTEDGCRDTVKQSLVVNETPKASFTSSFNNVLDSMFFTNTSTPLSGATWLWDFGDLTTSTVQNPVHKYTSGGTFTVTLTETTDAGCTSVFSATVEINKPNAAFTASTNNCTNSLVTFTNSSSFSGGTITSYLWDFGDNTTSTLENPTHAYANSGTFTVLLTVTANTGTKGTISKTVVVNDKPIVAFAGDVLTGCSPLVVNFSDNSTADAGSTYKWSFDDNTTSTDQNPQNTFSTSKTYTIKEVVVTPGGCSDSLIKVAYISVVDGAVVDFTVGGGCVNSSIDFTDNSSASGSTITTRSWTFGDNSSSSVQNPSHTYTVSGNYSVTLTCITNLGCESSKTETVTINSKPVVQFSATNVSGCIPLSTSFIDQTVASSGAVYSWDFGDGTTGTGKNPSHLYSSNGFFTVTEKVELEGGCSDSLIKVNYINVLSSVQAKFVEKNLCATSSSLFFDSSIVSSGTVTEWNWNFGNGSSSSLQNPNFVFTNSGTYNVSLTVTTDKGCTNSISKFVTVDVIPNADFKVDVLAGCVPLDVNFTDLTSAASNSTYSWNFGDGSAIGSTKDIAHTFQSASTFSIKYIVTSPQGCIDSILKTNLITTSNPPVAKFTFEVENGKKLKPKKEIEFKNKSTGASSYLWDFGDEEFSTIKNPKHAFSDTGEYAVCLDASSSPFCKATFCDTLVIFKGKKIAIPSAFSPNGDDKNDKFKVLGGPCKELHIKVFNEWGKVIFESNSQTDGWDGTYKGAKQPVGTYTYTIKGKFDDDEEFNEYGVIHLTR